MSVIRAIGNVVWFVIGGWWTALLYLLASVICCITIIGIPIGKACFQYAKLMAFPFGKTIVKETFIKGKENVSVVRRFFGALANILWFPFGIAGFLGNVIAGVGACLTIIGIPIGLVLFKCSVFIIWPVGAKVIKLDEKQDILDKRSEERIMQRMQKNGMMPALEASNAYITPAENREGTDAVTNASRQLGEGFKASADKAQKSMTDGIAAVGSALTKTGDKVSEAAKKYGQQGVNHLRAVYNDNAQRAMESDNRMSWEEVMRQTEAALYRNQAIAVGLSFLDYFAIAFTILCIILGLIQYHSVRGLILGLTQGGIVFALMGILFSIKRRYEISVVLFWGMAALGLLTMVLNLLSTGFGAYVFFSCFQIAVCVLFGLVAFLLRKG